MGYRREQNVSCRNKNPQEFWGTSWDEDDYD